MKQAGRDTVTGLVAVIWMAVICIAWAVFAGVMLSLILPARAEASTDQHLLSSHGDWNVYYVEWEDRTTSCIAEVRGRVSSFAVQADGKSPPELWFYDHRTGERVEAYGMFVVGVDSYTPWRLYGVYNDVAVSAPLDDLSRDLVAQLYDGHVLTLYDLNGQPFRVYSLRGSAAALSAFAGCLEKLR